MLHGKIHRVRVTGRSLDYPGSITIDEDLMRRAGIVEFEKVLVANLTTGMRFETYAIAGRRDSGDICLNGAAARLGEIGDIVIIMAFAVIDDGELGSPWRPRVVAVDEENRAV